MPYTFVKDQISSSLGEDCTEDTAAHIAKVLIKAFDLTASTNFSIVPITSGYSLTAKNFTFTVEGKKYVFRLTDIEGNVSSRENEVRAHVLLGKNRISPFMQYSSADEGVIISQFIEDKSPKWTGEFTDEMASNLAFKLRSLHETPISAALTNTTISASGLPNDSRERVLNILVQEKGFHLLIAAMELLTGLEQLLAKETLIHHDLHGGNILFDGADFWFIDLEHTGVGDPYVDLAVISLITNFSKGMPERFLQYYFGRELTETEEKKLCLAKVISSLRYAISSFSNCKNFASIQQETVPGTCKFTDFSPAIDGTPDVNTDPGKYWQCIALVKQALDAMADPAFQQVIQSLAGPIQKTIPLQELFDENSQWMQERTPFTVLALANLLRIIAAADPVEVQSGNHQPGGTLTNILRKARELLMEHPEATGPAFIRQYDSLEQLLNIDDRKTMCHNELNPEKLIWISNGITEEFGLQDWESAAVGYELTDLATLVHTLGLSAEQEQLLLLSYFGSRISEADQVYYEIVRRFIALRILLLETGRATTVGEQAVAFRKITREVEYGLNTTPDPLNLLKTL